jgi:putative Mg2+ transporter-C (MgtC) family protein
MGGAVGYGLYDIAVIISLVTFLTLRSSRPLKKSVRDQEGGKLDEPPTASSDRPGV